MNRMEQTNRMIPRNDARRALSCLFSYLSLSYFSWL